MTTLCPNCTSESHARCCARCGAVHRPGRLAHEFCSAKCEREQAREDRISAAEETPRPKPGPRPRDPSGSATPVAIRLAPAVVSAATAAAEAAGKSMRTWAADVIRDAAEAHGPRFATLEEVVAYVDGLSTADRAELASRLTRLLLRRPEHLRAAIVLAWLAGDRGEIAGACEEWERGER